MVPKYWCGPSTRVPWYHGKVPTCGGSQRAGGFGHRARHATESRATFDSCAHRQTRRLCRRPARDSGSARRPRDARQRRSGARGRAGERAGVRRVVRCAVGQSDGGHAAVGTLGEEVPPLVEQRDCVRAVLPPALARARGGDPAVVSARRRGHHRARLGHSALPRPSRLGARARRHT